MSLSSHTSNATRTQEGRAHGATLSLAQEALSFSNEDLSDEVREIARHCLLDWTSVALAAWDSSAVKAVTAWIKHEPSSGKASLLGSGELVSVTQAALVNGTASHVLDFDDAHLPSRVHPSVPLWPALLAFSEASDVSGTQILAAFVAGVQVQSRLAAVMGNSHYREGWHNTATLGGFGAAAAIGRLQGLQENRLCAAFGLAATLAGGLRSVFGSAAKPLHAGRAAANGIMACGLAREGLEAPLDILERPEGFMSVYASQHDVSALTVAHRSWEIQHIVFKYHTSCYGTQAPIEAALALKANMDPTKVQRLEVFVEPQYLSVCNIERPSSAAQAKFSISHMVALVLAGRDTSNDRSLGHENLVDTEVIRWRDRVLVQGDATLPRANARVVAYGGAGKLAEASFDASLPQQNLPYQRSRLQDKSMKLLSPYFHEEAISLFQSRLLAFDQQKAMGSWFGRTLQDLLDARR